MTRADCTALILCSLCLGCLALPGRAQAQSLSALAAKLAAKSTYHDDKSHTESVRDPDKRQLTEASYNNSGLLESKSIMVLNDNGLPTQGLIYDGMDNVVGHCQFYFDDYGRTIEERKTNMTGQVYERIIQQYDASGQPKEPKLFTYSQNSPRMKTSSIDFTGTKSRSQVGEFAPSQPHASVVRGTTPPPDASPASVSRSSQGQGAQRGVAQPGKPLEIITISPGSR